MAMDPEDAELAEDVAGMIADRIGEAMSLRGASDVDAIVVGSTHRDNVAELDLDDGGKLIVRVEVRR